VASLFASTGHAYFIEVEGTPWAMAAIDGVLNEQVSFTQADSGEGQRVIGKILIKFCTMYRFSVLLACLAMNLHLYYQPILGQQSTWKCCCCRCTCFEKPNLGRCLSCADLGWGDEAAVTRLWCRYAGTRSHTAKWSPTPLAYPALSCLALCPPLPCHHVYAIVMVAAV
jgi:hypothetical protein